MLASLDDRSGGRRKDGGRWTRRHTVNPVVMVPDAGDGARTKRSRGVQRASGVVHAHELSDEEREADTHGSHERSLVLFLCQHEDGEDELGGENGFDEDAADERSIG